MEDERVLGFELIPGLCPPTPGGDTQTEMETEMETKTWTRRSGHNATPTSGTQVKVNINHYWSFMKDIIRQRTLVIGI